MKKFLICLILFTAWASCKEITHFYTREYRYSYARPIGLMMSQEFDSLQLTGKGIAIGVIDAGFGGFKTNEFTQSLTVKAYRDFIDEDTVQFFSADESDHGTLATKAIGGRNAENKVHGLARDGEYYLAKTDMENSEPKEDEIRLIKAVQWLVDQDVKLINISLGFTVFDDDKSYTHKMLNGKTALCSRFIDSLLAARKDLIIVVSAGNEGRNAWQYLTFPADVNAVITVGSTDFEGVKGYERSGKGVEYVDYIKPEVATYPAPAGNSFTAPVITGLIACLLEKYRLDRPALKKIIIESSSHYTAPNRETGYGVPDTRKILELLKSFK